jgi:hypothetical protein
MAAERNPGGPARGTHGRLGGNFAPRALRDTDDVEEFPLLLESSDVTALIAAARQQGLSAAGLARRVIGDYLRQTRPLS